MFTENEIVNQINLIVVIIQIFFICLSFKKIITKDQFRRLSKLKFDIHIEINEGFYIDLIDKRNRNPMSLSMNINPSISNTDYEYNEHFENSFNKSINYDQFKLGIKKFDEYFENGSIEFKNKKIINKLIFIFANIIKLHLLFIILAKNVLNYNIDKSLLIDIEQSNVLKNNIKYLYESLVKLLQLLQKNQEDNYKKILLMAYSKKDELKALDLVIFLDYFFLKNNRKYKKLEHEYLTDAKKFIKLLNKLQKIEKILEKQQSICDNQKKINKQLELCKNSIYFIKIYSIIRYGDIIFLFQFLILLYHILISIIAFNIKFKFSNF